jgi:predicted NAD-dependent protein-ADP-ribosyltransferase YbiA (DUF1768 family)/lysophospholipase L1-like esterase
MAALTDIENHGLEIQNRLIKPQPVERSVTNVAIKDLPCEMTNETVAGYLAKYGQIVQGSIQTPAIKSYGIETGSRQAQMLNVKQTIPNEARWGRWDVRLFCDNGKSACLHCESTDHPHYQCPNKHMRTLRKACYRCGQEGHIQRECPTWNRATAQESETVTAFRGEQNVLSNLYVLGHPITHRGKDHFSVEHGYKTAKVKHYGREDLIPSIQNTRRAKHVMDMVDAELREVELDEENLQDWRDKRTTIMEELLREKFRACTEFREAVMNSKEIITEATSHPFWASGLPGIDVTLRNAPENWPGKNVLGCLMVELRQDHAVKNNPTNSHDVPVVDAPETQQPNQQTETTDTTDAERAEREGDDTTEEQNAENTGKVGHTKDQDDDEVEDHIVQDTLIIADSILTDVKVEKEVVLIARSGATLKDTEELLMAGLKESEDPNIGAVVIALGTNDIKNTESSPKTIVQLNKAIETVNETFPEAEVFLSGIIPRKGQTKNITNCNLKSGEVNQYMQEYAKSMSTVSYISNTELFNVKKVQIKELYAHKDTSGLHLTQSGRRKLMINILDHVKKNEQSRTPASNKRNRSMLGNTPTSAEQDSKRQHNAKD